MKPPSLWAYWGTFVPSPVLRAAAAAAVEELGTLSAKPLTCNRCQRDGSVSRRAGGYWCTYCHRTVKPGRKRQGAWERAEKIAAKKAAYREANREKIAAKMAAYREANREKIAAQQAAYRAANREKIAAQQAAYREANREKIAAKMAAYREANREKLAAQQAAYREANREKIAAKMAAYREANRKPVECAECAQPFYRSRGRPPRVLLCEACKAAAKVTAQR